MTEVVLSAVHCECVYVFVSAGVGVHGVGGDLTERSATCLLWSDSVLVQSPACRQWSHSDTLHCPHTSLKGLTAWMRALSSL